MSAEEITWEYRNPYEWMKRVRAANLPPLIICCAITGGVHGKEANIHLPETPEEQAQQTYEAYQAGASMVHIHARDPQKWYNTSGDPKQYRLIHRMIREKCPEIIINDTTGGSWDMTVEERVASLEAQPEAASLNMGPDMFKMTLKERREPVPSPRPEVKMVGCMPITFQEITTFARAMKQRNIKPEMEMYQPGQIWGVHDLIAQGLIEPPYLVQFVMGYTASSYATPANLLGLINELPDQSIYFVAGLGPFQLPMVTMSIMLGGHIRVGLEDNVYASRGQLYQSNAEAVERVVRIAKDLNREIATPAQARQMLGVSATPTQY
jgi:3-keto-5-aminohexanoate cleavage enzyme